MPINLNKVWKHVDFYLKEHLPKYTLLEIRKKSCYPNDDYLYMVSAKKEDGSYAFWSSWNERLQTLNHGHYNLQSVEDCEKLFEEFYYEA